MNFCTQCGRPKTEGARFCTGCGMPFPDAEATVPPGPVAQGQGPPPPAAPVTSWPPPPGAPVTSWPPPPGAPVTSWPPPPGAPVTSWPPPPGAPASVAPDGESRRPRRSLQVAIIAVVVMALAGGGTAAALVLSGGHGRASAAPPPRHTASHASTPTPTQSSPSPTPSSPTVSTGPAGGPVAVVPSVTGDARTPQVVTFLDSYFSAVNAHSYQAYIALLSPRQRQGLTAARFNSGFGSTRDSNETLQSISTAPDGSTVATVTFVSHQNPAQSVNGSESCTRWRISLYLEQDGTGYLIGKSPPGYHASYAAC
jgi:hypothetical protein